MPRVCGVSSTSTLWLRHLSPRPRTVARWSGFFPTSPRTSVTRSFFGAVMALGFRQLFDRQTALGGDFGRPIAVFERIERRAHDVVRVGRSVALGQDIGHADHVEYRAHRSAGNDAGALG